MPNDCFCEGCLGKRAYSERWMHEIRRDFLLTHKDATIITIRESDGMPVRATYRKWGLDAAGRLYGDHRDYEFDEHPWVPTAHIPTKGETKETGT